MLSLPWMELACAEPPRPEEIHIFYDGNAWTAHRAKGYTNMQECPTGFGDTAQEALTSLLQLDVLEFSGCVARRHGILDTERNALTCDLDLPGNTECPEYDDGAP